MKETIASAEKLQGISKSPNIGRKLALFDTGQFEICFMFLSTRNNILDRGL